METPSGKERERLVGLLMDHGDDAAVRMTLSALIGVRLLADQQRQLWANGGGTLTLRDLCAIATNYNLARACKALKIIPRA